MSRHARPQAIVLRHIRCLLLPLFGCAHPDDTGDTGDAADEEVVLDADGDTILDVDEGAGDCDGTPDYLDLDSDAWGFVTDVDPASHSDVLADGTADLDFEVAFEGVVAPTTGDQHFPLTFEVLGDDAVLLGSVDVIAVVPGEGP